MTDYRLLLADAFVRRGGRTLKLAPEVMIAQDDTCGLRVNVFDQHLAASGLGKTSWVFHGCYHIA